MYYYGLEWYYYEEGSFFELMHKKKFTDEEFKKMCDEAVVYVVKQLLKRKPEEDPFKIGFYHPDFMKLMVKYLERKYGFKRIKYTAVAKYWGMDIIDRETDSSELEKFRKIVGDELLEKVIEHNEKTEKFLDEKIEREKESKEREQTVG